MSSPPSRSQRWLVALVATLVLMSADGLHALTHWDGDTARLPGASGRIEAHAGDCPHRTHTPAHHDHQCLLCHQGAGPHALVVADAAVRADAPCAVALWLGSMGCAGPASVQGVLGARGPPLLSV